MQYIQNTPVSWGWIWMVMWGSYIDLAIHMVLYVTAWLDRRKTGY